MTIPSWQPLQTVRKLSTGSPAGQPSVRQLRHRSKREWILLPTNLRQPSDYWNPIILPLTGFAGEVEVVDVCWSNCVEVGAPGIRRMFDRLDTAAADLDGNMDARLAIRGVVRDYRAGVATLEQAHVVVQSVLAEFEA